MEEQHDELCQMYVVLSRNDDDMSATLYTVYSYDPCSCLSCDLVGTIFKLDQSYIGNSSWKLVL